MRARLILSAMATLVVGNEALADGVNYSYLQGNALLSQLSAHGSAMNGSGLGVEGGIGLGQHLFLFGGYNANKYSQKEYAVTTNTHTKIWLTPGVVGAGAHVSVFSSFDVFVAGSLERIKLKIATNGNPTARDTFDGWGATLGLRGWFSDTIQWDIGLKYSEVAELKTVLGYSFTGRYYFRSDYSFGVDINGRMYDDNALDLNESVVAIVFRHDFGVRF